MVTVTRKEKEKIHLTNLMNDALTQRGRYSFIEVDLEFRKKFVIEIVDIVIRGQN